MRKRLNYLYKSLYVQLADNKTALIKRKKSILENTFYNKGPNIKRFIHDEEINKAKHLLPDSNDTRGGKMDERKKRKKKGERHPGHVTGLGEKYRRGKNRKKNSRHAKQTPASRAFTINTKHKTKHFIVLKNNKKTTEERERET